MRKFSNQQLCFLVAMLTVPAFLIGKVILGNYEPAYASKIVHNNSYRELKLEQYSFGNNKSQNLFDTELKLGPDQRPEVFKIDIFPPVRNDNDIVPKEIISEIDIPLNDGVEDYANVKESVKHGVRQMGAWLVREMNIHPVITSGVRSKENNAAVKGSPTSWHLTGDAVDLAVGKLTPSQKNKITKKANQMGWDEVLYHDAGEGFHLHLAHLKRMD